MSTTRNQSPIFYGGIVIQPSVSPRAPNQQTSRQSIALGDLALDQRPSINTVETSANFNNRSTIGIASGQPVNFLSTVQPILDPLTALNGTTTPFIISPIIFIPRPNPIRLLTNSDLQEETLSLDTFHFVNGQTILDVSNLRCEILSLQQFKSIYDTFGNINNFGEYFQDIYQSSLVRDSLRKYLLVNRSNNSSELPSILGQISTKITNDIAVAKNTIGFLDSLIVKIKNINNVLDIKKNLSDSFVFVNPNQPLKEFFTTRMLFSEKSYNLFSDTKTAYQLLFDLSGILEKCSFNLLSGFTDNDRQVNIANPSSTRRQNIQDSITMDLSYGDNLAYTSDTTKAKYVTNSVVFNSILNALPSTSTNRFKFIVNLLSKEMRVSKGLGKYNIPENNFFGFRNQGNPFDNIIGNIPVDIFSEPSGLNSLSTLFYINTGNQNTIVLPFENRQVVGDNETIFVPGSVYFSDGILKNDFTAFNNYRQLFSTRFTNAKNVFEKLLTKQSNIDASSQDLTQTNILKASLSAYKTSQDFIRSVNYDSLTVLTYIMLLSGLSDPNIKFEVYKLLLLIILYDGRKDTTQTQLKTDKFRDLLFDEISQQRIQGFNYNLTENNLVTATETQISVVKNLLITSLSKNKSSKNQNKSLQTSTVGNTGQKSPQIKSNPTNSAIQISVQQFDQLINCLKTEQNLFLNIVETAKTLFLACSDNDNVYYTIDNSSLSRYNNFSISTIILLTFEMFSSLTDQFAKPFVSSEIIDGLGSKSTESKQIKISFIGTGLLKTSSDIRQFLSGVPYNNQIISDYDIKLKEEDTIISNIILFFDRLNQQLSNPVGPSSNESTILSNTVSTNANSISTTRTAKSILSNIVNKISLYNPTNNPNLNFYLPNSKPISDNNYKALLNSLENQKFLFGRNKIATVGVPFGFVNSAISAKLSKNETFNGKLQEEATDLVKVKIYKISKNDESITYLPQTFVFDLSLFAKGFDAYSPNTISDLNYDQLHNIFQFYDFDEDIPFSEVTPKNITAFETTDPYYSRSVARKEVCREAVKNLFNSFLLDIYSHLISGLNSSEEVHIKYTQDEINGFVSELNKIDTNNIDYSKIKFMSPEYKPLLDFFKSNSDDLKLMLTLCNDLNKTIFREKEYDRTFNVLFNVDQFEIDINTMNQTQHGKETIGLLRSTNKLYDVNGHVYKRAEEFLLDQYFINVELFK